MNDQSLNNSKKPVNVDELPQTIYDWAVSSVLTAMIGDLNKRLGLDGVKTGIIPDLVGDIIIRALPPEQLLGKLAEYLELDLPKAATVAREIEEKMLRPIEVPLRRELGVDIKMIYLGTIAPAKPMAPIISPQMNPQTTPSLRPQSAPSAAPVFPPIYRPAPQTLPTPSGVGTPTNSVGATTPPIPPKPPVTPPSIPVKINVQPSQNNQSTPDQPFGADSWVNKVK